MTPEAILARHARSFAPAARILPPADRRRIARLYALCRTVDDLADTVGGPKVQARLTRLAHELRSKNNGDPLAAEACALFDARPEGLASFAQLVDTVAQDTGATRIADEAALEQYCMGVAGTVGVMVCTLFDIRARWHPAAADLGKAMQLTNICRDVAEDAQAGRRYLPYTLCPHDAHAIVEGDPDTRTDVAQAVATLLARADTLYASGRAGLPALPLRLRLAVAAAASMYAGIGTELRARSCDPCAGRVFVPRWRKLLLAAQGVTAHAAPSRSANAGRHHATS
ncbi:phytoene/squalene synthase family protein [Roseovarius sp. D22-M7]|uniref:phytoene/squalene synthase family protein n=1 Tax=Roseovarius sp. D22-M7 TaxID=3127116 RepID=UPI00300FED1F